MILCTEGWVWSDGGATRQEGRHTGISLALILSSLLKKYNEINVNMIIFAILSTQNESVKYRQHLKNCRAHDDFFYVS